MRLRRYLFHMKSSEFKQIIESSLYNEVKNRIITESEGETHEVYEVVCEGEPVEVCKTEEEAKEIVDKLKKEHPGKQFIIEKKTYESYDHMLDELDKMGEELQEKENQNMEKNPVKVKSLAEAILHAKESNLKKIKVQDSVIDVEETWKQMEEEESQCDECGDKYMEEESDFGPDYDKLPEDKEDKEDNKKEDVKKSLFSRIKDRFNDSLKDYNPDQLSSLQYMAEDDEKMVCSECGSGEINEEGICNECGYMKEEVSVDESNAFVLAADAARDSGKEEFEFPKGSGKIHKVTIEKDIQTEEKTMCEQCGSSEINEEGMCNECGTMKESTSKKLRLKESELVSLIGKMVTEAAKGQPGIPGIPGVTVTKRAQDIFKKESKTHSDEVGKKLKKYLSFEGNDNPEFPKPIGKGEKVAYKNTSENEENIEDNRGETASDVTFDYEPSEGFKDRVKKALEGDSTMGNSSDAGNVVKDKVGSKIVDKTKRKKESIKKKKDVSWGHSWVNPIDVHSVNESTNKLSTILEEELKKINRLSSYNKKTQ